jgi:hypothetical protein
MDTDPVTGAFEGCKKLTTGIAKVTKTCPSEICAPELIRTSLNIPTPEHARAETDESEVQRDDEDAVEPKRACCDELITPMWLPRIRNPVEPEEATASETTERASGLM